ncbi:MAG: hypothetical protein HRT86_17930 [Ilumatobacteraceae bacterium]|nr:hypothetical protein [Ilumatobacteraceae bacterium]
MLAVHAETDRLDQNALDLIGKIAAATDEEVRRHLPDLAERIVLRVWDGDDVIPETGEMGISIAAGEIAWIINADDARGTTAIARAQLRPTLFHELHHQVRGWTQHRSAVGDGLLDAVVSEGLATAFERDAASSTPLWGDYPAEVVDWYEEVRALPDDADFMQWMIVHDDGRRWIGYRAGTYIVDRAINTSGMSAAQLATTPTTDILQLADAPQRHSQPAHH